MSCYSDVKESRKTKARVKSALYDARRCTGCEGSDISFGESTGPSMGKYVEAMARLDRPIQMSKNKTAMQQKQVAQLQAQ